MINVLFDSYLKCRSGRRLPYYDVSYVEKAEDQELVWFHEGYGLMKLYRLHEVDRENYIAEPTKVSCYTKSDKWDLYKSNPELALNA